MSLRPFTSICLGFALSAVSGLGQVLNGIEALVGDAVITRLQVNEATLPIVEQLYRQYRTDREAFNERYTAARSVNLEEMIARELLLHEYESAEYSLPESLIEDHIQAQIRERWGNRRTLMKTLQMEGRTYESFKRQLRDQFIVEAMASTFLGQDRMVSPRQIQDYYEAHLDDYAVEEKIHLSMIVLNKQGGTNDPAPALAAELVRKLEQGESFRDLAMTYSEGSQRRDGGDWGWVERSVLREELAEVAFRLKPGETSDVIETDTACYIMRIEEIKETHYTPLTEVQEEIEFTLQSEARNERRANLMERLKRKTFVRLY